MTTPNAVARPGAGMRKWGKILAIVGAIMLVVCVVVGVILAVTGIGRAAGTADKGTTFTGSTSVTLEAGQKVQLYAPDDAATPMCEVTPADKVGDAPVQSSEVTSGGVTWESFDGFTATEAGSYQITCDGTTQVLAAPPVSIGGIFAGVGGILLGVLGGGLGLLMLIVGLVLFFIGRGKAKQAGAA